MRAGRDKGHDPCGQSHGENGANLAQRSWAANPSQGGTCGKACPDAICVPNAIRSAPTACGATNRCGMIFPNICSVQRDSFFVTYCSGAGVGYVNALPDAKINIVFGSFKRNLRNTLNMMPRFFNKVPALQITRWDHFAAAQSKPSNLCEGCNLPYGSVQFLKGSAWTHKID